jgi:hypothetical protein
MIADASHDHGVEPLFIKALTGLQLTECEYPAGYKRELSLRVSKRTRSSPYGGKESPAGYKALRHLAWRRVELRRASRKVQDQGGHDRLKKLRTRHIRARAGHVLFPPHAVPLCERTVFLEPQEAPGKLDQAAPHPGIACRCVSEPCHRYPVIAPLHRIWRSESWSNWTQSFDLPLVPEISVV